MSCLFISLLVGLSVLLTFIPSSHAGSKSNVLVIMTDDQDMLLDSLSVQPKIMSGIGDNGIVFDKHYCTVAWCCPSRVNFLTGRAAHNTNVTAIAPPQGGYQKFYENGLNDKWLPIWLQEKNIETYYVGKLMNQFQKNDVLKRKPKGWTHSQFLVDPHVYQYHNTKWTNDDSDELSDAETDHSTVVTQRRALALIDKAAAANRQFFMMVAPVAPHVQTGANLSPIPPPPPGYKDAFLDRTSNLSANWNPKDPSGASWVLELPRRSSDETDMFDDLYHHRLQNLAGIDDMVDGLLGRLKDHGLLDNTYVIYTSDNGYHIGNHRLFPGKKCGYEEDINIPLLIRGPDVPQGLTVSSFHSHTDLAPTILQMMSVPLQDDFDGQPIPYTKASQSNSGQGGRTELVTVEFWEPLGDKEPTGPTRRGDPAYFHRTYADVVPHARSLRHVQFDAEGDPHVPAQQFNNTYKSIRLRTPGNSFYYSVWCDGSYELYDMTTDPIQMNNLLPTNVASADSSGLTFFDRPPFQLVRRLDTLLLVTKNCKGNICRNPWSAIFPNLGVNDLASVMSPRFDAFFAKQPRVSFDTCGGSYIPDLEGPNNYIPFNTSLSMRRNQLE